MKKKNILLLCFCIWIMIACVISQPAAVRPIPTQQNDNKDDLELTPHDTEAVQDITPTIAPSETARETIAPTLAPTELAKESIAATLTRDEIDQRIVELSKLNSFCRFPCWWGIIPGVTTWTEAKNRLDPVAEIALYDEWDNSLEYSVFFDLPGKEKPGWFNVVVSDEQVEIIDVTNWASQDYPLDSLLSTYGIPDDIRLHTVAYSPTHEMPASVALLYSRANFYAVYEINSFEEENDIRICPSDETPTLYLYSPHATVTSELIDIWIAGGGPFMPPRPLIEVTNLMLEDFYKIYSTRSEPPHCFFTKKLLWTKQ